ncbi:RiboL-PSP-HEPN domain-containing protein [Candidatus Magnetomoraceae bacterium gMMP-1]
MIKRIPFSDQIVELYEIWDYYETTYDSLRNYLKGLRNNSITNNKFVGMTSIELESYFNKKFDELEYQVSLIILSSVEAKFRMDYLQRVYKRYRDNLTKKFRELYNNKANKASLEDDILELWKKCYPLYKNIISDYKGTLKFRHWLAHGRYWVPKFGKKYDLSTIYNIAERIYANLPFYI